MTEASCSGLAIRAAGVCGGPGSSGPPTGSGARPGTGPGRSPGKPRRVWSVRRCVRRGGRSPARRTREGGAGFASCAARRATQRGRECPQGAMMGLGLRVLPWRAGPWWDGGRSVRRVRAARGAGGRATALGGVVPPGGVSVGGLGVGGCAVRGRVVSSRCEGLWALVVAACARCALQLQRCLYRESAVSSGVCRLAICCYSHRAVQPGLRARARVVPGLGGGAVGGGDHPAHRAA